MNGTMKWRQFWRFVWTDMEKRNDKVWIGATNEWARHLIGPLWFIERNAAWTTPNTLPANGGVSDAPGLTNDAVIDLVKEAGLDWHAGFNLDDENRYGTLVRLAFNLGAALAQSRQPSAQGGERVEPVGEVRRGHYGGRSRNIGFQEAVLYPGVSVPDGTKLYTHPPAGGGKEALSDAERLDWLESLTRVNSAGLSDAAPALFTVLPAWDQRGERHGSLRSSIDAAIRAGKKG